MTISAIDTGSVLYFSHDELPTVRPLTQEAVLPLIRRALAKARHPIPPAMEVKSFSSRQGVLFLSCPGCRRRPPPPRSAEGFSPESLLFPLFQAVIFGVSPLNFQKNRKFFPSFLFPLAAAPGEKNVDMPRLFHRFPGTMAPRGPSSFQNKLRNC